MAWPRRVLLVQLPIPPLGPGPIRGNVPLAAGYLKLFARSRGLEDHFEIDILAPALANTLGDCDLVDAILDHEPWLAGFTCYLWNIDRTLWICERLKERRPDLRSILGGPEITRDNAWVLDHPAVDFAAIGEGEQTFAELLESLRDREQPSRPIAGLYARKEGSADGRMEDFALPSFHPSNLPSFLPRSPLPCLDEISSPYLAGILDAADERMLLLETIRGCVFKCKFCYYPKSYDALYFLSEEKIRANLRHAREREVREVVLLDPTLNQRRDFADFLRLLGDCNPEKQWTYFGELRAEGINSEIAGLLREANFTEVEIGLQSTDPHAQELMDRKNSLRAFERGVRALLDAGIRVKVDLIIGLPGDTPDTVRRSMSYLRESGLYTDVQVFNLAVLPGTAFRQEAEHLGLKYQARPPYYVLETPTLDRADMFQLMQEAQEVFETDWDPLPEPVLDRSALDQTVQAFTLWLRSVDFERDQGEAARRIGRLLDRNPFTTLQVVLEPLGEAQRLSPRILGRLLEVCHRRPTYLDRYYALQPGRPIGAKRLVVLLPANARSDVDERWLEQVGELATVVWDEPAVREKAALVRSFSCEGS